MYFGKEIESKNLATEDKIVLFLREKQWVDPKSVAFLAAGEYNENYRVTGTDADYVFRINHGSQLGIKNQIEYEFRVLQHLSATGVTPVAYYCDPDPGQFAGGVLLMTFFSGRPFQYIDDSKKAAETFAKIHQVLPSPRLLNQYDPINQIISESEGLLARFSDHPKCEEKKRLFLYRDELLDEFGDNENLFVGDQACVTNTEVNSGNFIVEGRAAFLVDWEKAVNSYRYQDLGHFLVPTTTLWKSDFCFDSDRRIEFLRAYHTATQSTMEFDLLDRRTRILERVILLRALSWCFMAFYEYTRGSRDLQNQGTFKRICWYLDDIDHFLRSA
ncbi:MAG: aminoglycoside phosphotransferase [Spirochaetales bacterium]|nr:aminoglycoside phosphotransferase [Spirochaetales bacterium]